MRVAKASETPASVVSARQRYAQRKNALANGRNNALATWREITDYVRPRRGRYNSSASGRASESNQRNDQKIINSIATLSSRVLGAGMMAGISSPARPWKRLTTHDPTLATRTAVKAWLHEVEETMRLVMARSNIYQGLHQVYCDLGDFGTTAMLVEDDDEDIIRAFVLPLGQYYLDISEKMRVDTVVRELGLTARQMLRMFREERCSQAVKDAIRQQRWDARFDVLHVVEPNDDHSPGTIGPSGFAWKSCWVEPKAPEGGAQYLRESGFEEFPYMCPRWEVNDEDTYASDSPGMIALPDTKALQLYEKRKAELVDKLSKPPMTGPSSMRNQRISLLPGDMNYVDAHNSAQTFRPAIEIEPQALQAVELSIEKHEVRIKRAYYADLWLALLNDGTGQMTAREVSERHEEKMLQLGPVMERLQDELLDPLVDRVFNICFRNGLIPEAPPELQGQTLRVEYISIMSQAQKMLGIGQIERLVGSVASAIRIFPRMRFKIDEFKVVNEYSAGLGVKPDLIRSDEEAAKMEKAEAEAMARQAQLEQANQAAQGAKTLSETQLGPGEGDNALKALVNGVAPTAVA